MKFIYNDMSLKSGVYKIINTKNGRIYIGSAKEFKRRGKQHLKSLQNNKHRNKFIQADFNKCGEKVYEFHVLEVVEGNKSDRILVEQKYIDQYFDNGKQCYNLQKRANPTEGYKISRGLKQYYKTHQRPFNMGTSLAKQKTYDVVLYSPDGKKFGSPIINLRRFCKKHDLSRCSLDKVIKGKTVQHKGWVLAKNKHLAGNTKQIRKPLSEETKLKISKANKGQVPWCKGRKMSKEFGEKISKALQGNQNCLGNVVIQATKDKIAKANCKTYNVVLVSPEYEEFGPIINITKFCKQRNLSPTHMLKVINKERLFYNGWALKENKHIAGLSHNEYKEITRQILSKKAKEQWKKVKEITGTIGR